MGVVLVYEQNGTIDFCNDVVSVDTTKIKSRSVDASVLEGVYSYFIGKYFWCWFLEFVS
jgi:hypothetical protein